MKLAGLKQLEARCGLRGAGRVYIVAGTTPLAASPSPPPGIDGPSSETCFVYITGIYCSCSRYCCRALQLIALSFVFIAITDGSHATSGYSQHLHYHHDESFTSRILKSNIPLLGTDSFSRILSAVSIPATGTRYSNR